MALKYSSKHDISYINYNNKNIPWQLNTTFISQNNQIINPSLNLGSINNNLLIESSQNNIVLRTPQNKKVFATNSMTVNDNLDVSNTLTTTEVVVEDICLNNILYLPSLPINIIGNLKVHGSISVINSTTTGTGLAVSKSEFINVTLTTSNFTDVSIVDCTISVSDFSNVNIINSYIYGIPIGYDKSNNSVPNEAIFSDISLENLILDSSLNSASFINFSNIIIKSSDDYSKLEISKPLNIELSNSVTNISNISVFNGDISCNILYYSQLFPDIRLNNYFDISIGQVSVSGNIIPSLNNTFNVGSSTNKFNTITSTLFIGDLSGRALLANDLVKNLDMSFNTLDVYGTITLNKKSLAQFVSGDLITIVAAEVSFNNVNNNVTDLSRLLYSKQGFDLCLNTNFAKRSLLESSFINLNNNITSIANNVYIKSDFDLCLNRNFIRTSDISAITSIVSSPSLIYPSLINLNSSLNKVVNASAVNELAFPYAITYIDDNVEDTNLKESYSYRKTTVNTTFNTTTTQTTTINYSYQMNSRPVSGAEPNNLGENRLTMWSANGGANDIYRRTWNDVNGQGAGPAVYKIPSTQTTTQVQQIDYNATPVYEVNTTSYSWNEHRVIARTVAGRDLAVILDATQNNSINSIPGIVNNRDYIIGGSRRSTSTNPSGTSATDFEWVTGSTWSYQNFFPGYQSFPREPAASNGQIVRRNFYTSDNIYAAYNGHWDNYGTKASFVAGAIYGTYPTTTTTTTTIPARYEVNTSNLSWEDHRLNAISIGAELAVITNATENEAVGTAAQNAGLNTVYIGGRRTSNSTNAYGITSADWEWHNGTAWSYSNFFRGGQTEQFEVRTESSPIVSSPQTGQPVQVSSNTQNEDTNLSIVKLPLLVSSANGSIVATATAINVPSIPSNTSSNTSANPVLISDITTGPVVTRQSSITTNTKIHSYTTTNITYTLNNGLTSGSFNISNNSNNNSNYIKSTAAALPSTITTSYSCIAVTNDGMFVALGKANDVTVYMRNSTGWSALGSPIGVQFSAYTESSTGIIPTQFTDINWRKNLQNLAINYISGENQPRIFLAFGDTRNSVKIYSYDNGSWTFPNGFYSVSSGSWVLKHTHLASALGASNNFGYFVVLSHNPRILVFTIDDRFYSYNCSDSLFTARGSSAFIRLPTAVTNFTNIIALKISADADKVIVSNTHYVFVYKWNNASSSWTQVTVLNVAPLSQPSTVLQGTGGTITTSGGYIIHRFNTSGTFRPLTSSSVEVLIVGGGGGGGSNLGGGGGGGAVIWIPATNVTADTSYSIVVGDGGASGTSGQNSSAFTAIAAGGGTSGSYDTGIGTAGGSGGGAAANGGTINQGGGVSNVSTLGSNSGFIYGCSGGNMLVGRTGGPTRAAGGGGAGPNGTGKALDTNSNTTGDTGRTGMGSGGVGYSSSILGPTYLWGGGGGGAGWDNQVGGYGGLGGGGGGSGLSGGGLGGGSALVDGSNGLVGGNSLGGNGGTNTGGGGGGGNHSSGQGGRGGSGIVVIRYLQTPNIAGPRSLDISNINTNNDDCVFAIGFPDKLITSRANNRSRGYVEYYQCLTSSPSAIITKLATLVPRKRDITNNNVDSDEYYFSIGGIKITNANTILVSPNYKFHFYSTTKNYEYNSTPRIWNDHSSNVITVAGRRMASIENELEQELVRINARNNQLWLGGRRRASSVNANGTTMLDWEWISPDSSWNYVNWGINQPDNVSEKRLHLVSNGSWNDLPETSALPAMYMTRSLSYSLNTFVIFDKFFFHSSGFFSSYFPTDVSNLVIARWATTDTPLNRSIEIRASGQIFSRSYGAISDIRLKENIVDVSPKLVDLLKVRVVNYNLKGCKDAKFIGVVAQELEQIFPALVKNGDLSPQDINLHKTETYKYVKYSCFDIMLIKAFQEQMDIINKLSFQVVELESKSKLLKTISQYNVILNEDLDFLKRENELLKQNINEILMLMAKC